MTIWICNLKDVLTGGYAQITDLSNQENDSIVQSSTKGNLVRNKKERA